MQHRGEYHITYISRKLASASWSLLALASIPGLPKDITWFFPRKGPPCPLPHINHCYISYIIYPCCILVGTNYAATRWWQSLRNSPLPFLRSPTPLAFVIHPQPQVYTYIMFLLVVDSPFEPHLRVLRLPYSSAIPRHCGAEGYPIRWSTSPSLARLVNSTKV
jgi:hypothetical protein